MFNEVVVGGGDQAGAPGIGNELNNFDNNDEDGEGFNMMDNQSERQSVKDLAAKKKPLVTTETASLPVQNNNTQQASQLPNNIGSNLAALKNLKPTPQAAA